MSRVAARLVAEAMAVEASKAGVLEVVEAQPEVVLLG